jgi:hypothetical protein
MTYVVQLSLFILQLIAYFSLGFLLVKNRLKTDNRLTYLVVLTLIGSATSLFISYLLAWLNLGFLLSFICLGSCIYLIINRREVNIPKFHLPILLVCSLTGLVFAGPLLTSGWMNQSGMLFWFVNHTDSMINIALIQELIHRLPPQHPGFAGIDLKGYHVLYNLLVADFGRVFQTNVLWSYLHWYPVWMGISITTLLFSLGKSITKRTSTGWWVLFFSLFGGSWVFAYNYLFPLHRLSIDDGFGITNPVSLMGSPAFVYGLILLLVGFIIIRQLMQRSSNRLFLIGGLLFGLLISIKVYLGMIGLPIWLLFCLLMGWKKKQPLAILAGVISILITAAVFLPMNGNYGHLIYQRFWPAYRLMEGNFHWTDWILRIHTYRANNNWFGVLRMELLGILFFLIGNLGTRIIAVGVLFHKQTRREITFALIGIMLLIIMLFGFFFIQPIGTYNMIQLFWAGMVLIGILAGVATDTLLEKIKPRFRWLLLIFLVGLTLPSSTHKLISMHRIDPYLLPNDQLKFYQTVQQQGSYNDTVLYLPDKTGYKRAVDWIYTDQVLPLAMSNKRFYLSPEIIQFRYEELFPERIKQFDILLQDAGEPFLKTVQAIQSQHPELKYIITEGDYQSVGKIPGIQLIKRIDHLAFYQLP